MAGDFIFYSVLVSEAANAHFATFVGCLLVVIIGLGSTLLLLAVYEQALPALPISIALGVIMWFLGNTLLPGYLDRIHDAAIFF